MKTTHKILFGLIAAGTLAMATPSANAYVRGHYVRHHGHYGYYYSHRFYAYNAGPYPYYYGPWGGGPGVTVVAPAPAVVIAPRRRHVFFFF